MIYFDHNATTPLDPLVLEAMQPFFSTLYGNPSSLHRHGRAARTAIELARQQVAELVNTQPEHVIFTSGGTEANNLAILGAYSALETGDMLFGATEHPSVNDVFKHLSELGSTVKKMPVDSNGQLIVDEFESIMTAKSRFVSVMQANNETGVIQDIPKLAEFCSAKNIVIHTDAVQSCGKIAVDFPALGVDLMSLSAHKIYGPKGIGALIVNKKSGLTPLFYGGGQESGIRPGTENTAAIVGFGKAAELAKQRLISRADYLLNLRGALEDGIKRISGLSIVAETAERLPNTCQIVIDNVDGEMLLMQLDKQSIAVSSGSACSSNSKEPSPVLKAMGYTDKLALSAIRISLGEQNTTDEVAKFVASLDDIITNP